MNKKLLSIIMITTLIMFVGINVKAGCNNRRDQSNQVLCSSTTCSTANETACKSEALKACCYWTNPACTSVDVTGCTGEYSANGEGCEISLDWPSSCTKPTISCSVSGKNLGSISNCKDFSTSYTGTDEKCEDEFTITVSSGGSSLGSTKGKVKVLWTGPNSTKCTTRTDFGVKAAEAAQASYYYSNCKVDTSCFNSGNSTANQLCDVYTRGCGKSNEPPEPQPHCYRDKNGFLYYELLEQLNKEKTAIDTSKVKAKGWEIATDNNGKEIPRDACYTKFGCSETPAINTKRTVPTSCNGIHEPKNEPNNDPANGELTAVYEIRCGIKYGSSVGLKDDKGNEKYLLYKIACTEKMRTAFNGPIFDDDKSFMYPGTGFGFHYLANTKVDCNGYFDEDYYNAARTYLKARGEVEDLKGDLFAADAKKRLEGIEKIESSYTNWTVGYDLSSIKGTIKDDQPDGKVDKEDVHEISLELEELNIETGSTCGELPKGTDGKRNNKFVYQELHNIKMKLPMLWYDKTKQYKSSTDNQYIVKNCDPADPKDPYCLGRIFPVSDSKEFAGSDDYFYTVTIENLGKYGNWTNYESCNIKMREKELYFRSINVSDPFIKSLNNSDHEIGQNWKNSKFDFTRIIDSNIWSKSPQYNMIRITEENGKKIKSEIANDKKYYVGICSNGTPTAASMICTKYNEAITK